MHAAAASPTVRSCTNCCMHSDLFVISVGLADEDLLPPTDDLALQTFAPSRESLNK